LIDIQTNSDLDINPNPTIPNNISGGANCGVSITEKGSLIQGSFTLGTAFPHILEGTPLNYNSTSFPWNIESSYLSSNLSAVAATSDELAFGAVVVTRVSYIPTGQLRWAGGYLWTLEYTGRNGMMPNLTHTNALYISTATGTGIDGNVTLETGTQLHPFLVDDPGTASTGNQIEGFYGLSFTDQVGEVYTSDDSYFPIANAAGQALSATQFQFLLDSLLGNKSTTNTNVSRSSSHNAAMGYTYSITFQGRHVGGNVGPLVPTTTNLITTHITTTSEVISKDITVAEAVVGAELQGSFQLRFNGFSTGSLAYDSDAASVEIALNNLASIAPSEVRVTRSDSIMTPTTQVSGFVWSVTFTSNTWIDPTLEHESYILGNWFGSPTTYADTWSTGYSKAWGKNVGNVPALSCIDSSLYVSNGALPADGCLVEEVTPGTAPLSGTFDLLLNTIGHNVINIQKNLSTSGIAHNAQGNISESGGDGTSMQEQLMKLTNIGEIEVTRSDVNVKNGGYSWFITFLRDDNQPGGQWGDSCEQKDSYYNLCNSPGNVPSLTSYSSGLYGNCQSIQSNATSLYNCSRITILTGDSNPSKEPPGSKAEQEIFLDNPLYDEYFPLTTFNMSYTDNSTGLVYHTACLKVNSTVSVVQAALEALTPLNPSFGSRGVSVTTRTDTVSARNGQVLKVRFFDEGYKDLLKVQKCQNNTYDWTVESAVVQVGKKYGMTALQAGVKNGVVQRGALTSLYVTGCYNETNATVRWNAPAEGINRETNVSIKSYLEALCPKYIVDVARTIIGQYGVVEYEVRFVYTVGVYPPGAGNTPILVVVQAPATDNNTYIPLVYEEVN
jgi:hypothetical protein